MIQVLMLDLDGTLLAADINEFLPAYMESLATALTEFAEPEAIISNLMASTQAMIANLDPTRTLKQAFDGRFFPALGRQPSELRDTVDDFYAGQYGQLKALTAPVEGARRLVDQASLAGLQMVVATNPLFPLTAIEQRLAWAGFAAHDSPFELISSYETFHFAKPNPAYYAEILGRLGVASHEAAVVGDDPINDLEPASTLGVAAYHVAKNPDDGWPGGPLEQAWTWL